MFLDVVYRAPEEACGLISGKERRAEWVYPVTNALHSPIMYRMDAQEQIDAFLAIEENKQELLAIYHSHPAGPESPSETDRVEFAYPGIITLIWFPRGESWACRAYWIENDQVSETTVRLVEDK